ncbi:hypothetical protein HMPREF9554_03040 [Treponema phagedenis F0421]|nr:hypothetical protein HMPREF9554_03040 [Treponema phagedenis F0421]
MPRKIAKDVQKPSFFKGVRARSECNVCYSCLQCLRVLNLATVGSVACCN